MSPIERPAPEYDVYCLGNAIVDILAPCDEAFLREHAIIKGAMNLVDAERSEALYEAMTERTEQSGGSAGNTAAGVAALGARAAYSGKVASDALGDLYRSDIRALGVAFDTEPLDGPPPTARSMIFVTPDAQRSMNTYLGACVRLGLGDVDEHKAANSAITYFEGYLWDPPEAKDMIRRTAEIAHANGRRMAMTLSDSFCVERYRPEFLDLFQSGTVDIVFANAAEVCALYETEDLEAATTRLGEEAGLAIITHGEAGSTAIRKLERASVEAWHVADLVDTTGAGDLYAAGFLTALSRGDTLERCATLGSFAAAQILDRYGPRPDADLAEKARENGLLRELVAG